MNENVGIYILSHRAMYTDAILRSMDIMWSEHPIPTVITPAFYSCEEYNILKKEHDIVLNRKTTEKKCFSLYLSQLNIFIRQYKLNVLPFKSNNVNRISLMYGKNTHKFNGTIINNNNFLHCTKDRTFNECGFLLFLNNKELNANIYIPDKSYIVNITQGLCRYTLAEMGKMYISGKRINIDPFLYMDNDNINIASELEFKWQ